MKKLFCLSLAVLLALPLLLASCGGSQTAYGKEVLSLTSQLDALNGLKKGDADITVIDSVMAGYYMNGTEQFADYQILSGLVLAEEQYGIAAAKGNEALMSKINEALIALADTDCKTVAEEYGLASELLVTKESTNPYANATDDSWDKAVQSGKLVVGYTLFAPIAYKDGDGADAALIGFDIDLAKAVVAYLNAKYNVTLELEFDVIDWNQKEALLQNGSIDLAWNGMTITPTRQEEMTVSIPYLANKQVAVIAKKDATKYACTDAASFAKVAKDAIIAVEAGSAGEEIVKGKQEG